MRSPRGLLLSNPQCGNSRVGDAGRGFAVVADEGRRLLAELFDHGLQRQRPRRLRLNRKSLRPHLQIRRPPRLLRNAERDNSRLRLGVLEHACIARNSGKPMVPITRRYRQLISQYLRSRF